MLTSTRSIWASCPKPDFNAGYRLFCFPYAGSGASIYRAWPDALRNAAEVWPVHLPGRERRLSDPPAETVQGLAIQTAKGIAEHLDRPFVLFGHSMGALICYEVALTLRRFGLREPDALFVSGYGGPHLPDTRSPIHTLPDSAFKDAVAALNGTPQDVIESVELMELLLPLLRADFKLVETYENRSDAPLDLPIFVYSGRDDRDTPQEALDGWSHCTRRPVSIKLFDGGHFYLHDHAMALTNQIRRDLQSLTPHHQDQRETGRH